jgi:hypothetical protein
MNISTYMKIFIPSFQRMRKLKGIRILLSFFALLVILLFSKCSKAPNCESLQVENSDSTACLVGMDVAFLIDYTGSMSDAIDNIKYSVNSIVNNIALKSGGDYQLALGIFDEYPTETYPLYFVQSPYASLPSSSKKIVTTNPFRTQYLTIMEKFSSYNKTSFINQLNKLNSMDMFMGSGVSYPEPGGLLAYEVVKNDFAGLWRSGKKKYCFIITDAPDGGDDDNADATDDLLLQNIASIADTNEISFILITTASAGINYETHLIDNNKGSFKLLNADFNNVSKDINLIINKLCDD